MQINDVTMTVQKGNPAKQGLKHRQAIPIGIGEQVQKGNPAKQGLKLIIIGAVVGVAASKKEIQQNKD